VRIDAVDAFNAVRFAEAPEGATSDRESSTSNAFNLLNPQGSELIGRQIEFEHAILVEKPDGALSDRIWLELMQSD
jgi:hypothetical protein